MPSMLAPIFFGLALHRRRRRVRHLRPVTQAARAVGRAEPLRQDAFEPRLQELNTTSPASCSQPQARVGLHQDGGERGLVDLKRIAAQVTAIG